MPRSRVSVPPLEPRTWHEAHEHVLEAAVDDDLLPVHVAGAVAREKQGHLGHVLGRRDASQWHGGAATLQHLGVLVEHLAHGRAHHAGADDIAAYAMRAP